MEEIILEDFSNGFPGITASATQTMIEACIICLASQNHSKGISLKVQGIKDTEYKINWNSKITNPMRKYWTDEHVTTEYGACCLAAILTLKLTDYTILERSAKGSGVDYWLGFDDDGDELDLGFKARLEISGIRKSNPTNTINSRVNIKKNQTKQSDESKLPAYVAVLEFSNPEARYIKK